MLPFFNLSIFPEKDRTTTINEDRKKKLKKEKLKFTQFCNVQHFYKLQLRHFRLEMFWKKQRPKVFCKKRCSYKFRKFCEISKNTFFIEHLWATASVLNIFLSFWGLRGSFSYKKCFYIKKCVVVVGRGEKPKKHRREWCLTSLLTGEIAIAGDSNTH